VKRVPTIPVGTQVLHGTGSWKNCLATVIKTPTLKVLREEFGDTYERTIKPPNWVWVRFRHNMRRKFAMLPIDTLRVWVAPLNRRIKFNKAQLVLHRKHGSPAEFAQACYAAVPGFISMTEASKAVAKYNQEWAAAGKV